MNEYLKRYKCFIRQNKRHSLDEKNPSNICSLKIKVYLCTRNQERLITCTLSSAGRATLNQWVQGSSP